MRVAVSVFVCGPGEKRKTKMEILGMWLGFGAMVVLLLGLDLFVFHRDSHAPTLKESAGWTMFWVALALGFNAFIWWWYAGRHGSAAGATAAVEFLTGYLVEWSLSMDNVFVFAVIFRFFRVPLKYQYRVLFWGILGAIFMRLGFILAGAHLMARFHWVLPLFGLFLIYAAVKLAFQEETEVEPDKNWILRLARRFLRVTEGDRQQRFFARENGRLAVTPLFLVLLVIESTDVLFAVDSVPAIIGVTRDPFIMFSSNIFAIMGLRALYFLLAGVIDLFRYLTYGLSAVLAFIGAKMVAEYLVPHEGQHLVPPWLSLVVVVALIVASIVVSLLAGRRGRRES
jgi:tellurite resistance protein TerC